MTVKELIELLETLPQDAQVALTHYWDNDDRQFDVICENSVSVENGKPRDTGAVVFVADPDGQAIVVIR